MFPRKSAKSSITTVAKWTTRFTTTTGIDQRVCLLMEATFFFRLPAHPNLPLPLPRGSFTPLMPLSEVFPVLERSRFNRTALFGSSFVKNDIINVCMFCVFLLTVTTHYSCLPRQRGEHDDTPPSCLPANAVPPRATKTTAYRSKRSLLQHINCGCFEENASC